MISITEKIESLTQERALLLSSKLSLEKNLEEATSEKNFLFNFLTNSSSNIGVLDFLVLFAKELNYWAPSGFTSPNLLDSQSNYSGALYNQMIKSITSPSTGDIYNKLEDKLINTESLWVKNNGYTGKNFTSGAFKVALDSLEGHLDILRLKRTAKDEEFPYDYLYRDYYNIPEKTNIENGITSLKNILATGRNSFCNAIETAINNIENNPYLKDLNINISTLESYLGFSTIIQGFESSLQSMLDYLSPIGPAVNCSSDEDYDRGDFDAFIGFFSKGAIYATLSGINNIISSRADDLDDFFDSNLTNELRKLYIFWLTLFIGKPQSTLLTLKGLENALADSVDSLKTKKDQLEVLFGSDYDKYLPTPQVVSVFLDEENRKNILINSLPCFSKIKIFRKEVSVTDSFTNIPYYTNLDKVEEYDISSTQMIFLDTQETNSNKIYSYRVSISDESEIDVYYSGSGQSQIIEDDIPFIIEEDNILTLGEHSFFVGETVYITGEGLFRILSKTSTTITVDRQVSSNGNLKKAFGFLFT